MDTSDWSRRGLISGAGALCAAPAFADPLPLPTGPAPTGTQDTLTSLLDKSHRLTTEVYLNGQGPFLFLVDTGADHSVVSEDLARALGLPIGPVVTVHGVAGDVTVSSAILAEFRVGSRTLKSVALPLLARENVGAAGVLGIDVLQGQRVTLDFRGGRILVSDSYSRRPSNDEVVVKARSRFGQLVLVDSTLEDEPVLVVIDTGAESSIANFAFARRVRSEFDGPTNQIAAIYSVTGQTATGRFAVVPAIHIGGFRMMHVPVVYSELRSFEHWRLLEQPALLLGMDVLRLFDAVQIDFARREVRFIGLHAQDQLKLPHPLRMATGRAAPPQA